MWNKPWHCWLSDMPWCQCNVVLSLHPLHWRYDTHYDNNPYKHKQRDPISVQPTTNFHLTSNNNQSSFQFNQQPISIYVQTTTNHHFSSTNNQFKFKFIQQPIYHFSSNNNQFTFNVKKTFILVQTIPYTHIIFNNNQFRFQFQPQQSSFLFHQEPIPLLVKKKQFLFCFKQQLIPISIQTTTNSHFSPNHPRNQC